MANKPFKTAKQGDVWRVVRGDEPQPEVDDGGFRDRQSALDAATQANVDISTVGSGTADKAADAIRNRQNKLDRAMERAR